MLWPLVHLPASRALQKRCLGQVSQNATIKVNALRSVWTKLLLVNAEIVQVGTGPDLSGFPTNHALEREQRLARPRVLLVVIVNDGYEY